MTGDAENGGADIGVKIAGQEVNIRNVRSLNTIATVCTLIGVCVLGVFVYYHEVSAQSDKVNVAATLQKSNTDISNALKESNTALVNALKESNANTLGALKELTTEQRRSTQAIKEIACLNDPAMKNRNDARDFCKRMARDER